MRVPVVLLVSATIGAAATLGATRAGWDSERDRPTRAPGPVDPGARPDFGAIDRYVRAEMNAVRAPGVVLAIVHDTAVVHVRAFGVAAPDGRPVTAETPFILGSVSKAFTATAALQLAEAGRLDLDAPVQRYVPQFRFVQPDWSAQVTVRELLNQTSGIPKSAGLAAISERATASDKMRMLRRHRLAHPPGTTYEYSNANYWMLGLVVERVSGEPFAEYVQQHIFGPLGMASSFTDQTAAGRAGLAAGHRVWFGFPVAEHLPFHPGELSAGYLISSARDMARFLALNLNGGRLGDVQLLTPSSMALMHTPPPGHRYAMGWLADSAEGVPILWHTGAVANYHADMALVPSAGWGVVILTNVNNFLLERQFGRVTKGVAGMLVGGRAPRAGAVRYRETYWLITGVFVLWLAWRVSEAITIGRWRLLRARPRDARRQAALRAWLDPAVSLWLLVVIPWRLGATLPTLLWFTPDLTDWMVANAAVSLALVGVRSVLMARLPIAARREVADRIARVA